MRLKVLRASCFDVPFKKKFSFPRAHNSLVNQRYLIQVTTDKGHVAWGETASALSDFSIASAFSVLEGRDFSELAFRDLKWASSPSLAPTHEAILAILLQLRALDENRSPGTYFGQKMRTKIPISFWMPVLNVNQTERWASIAYKMGFRSFKLKTHAKDSAAARVRAIWKTAGNDCEIVLDPNRRLLSPRHAKDFLQQLQPMAERIWLEEPFLQTRLEWYEELRSRGFIRLMPHLYDVDSVRCMSKTGLFAAINWGGGLGITDGPWEFLKAARICAKYKIPIRYGSSLDCGLADIPRLLACAAAPCEVLPGDQSGPFLRQTCFVTNFPPIIGGAVDVTPFWNELPYYNEDILRRQPIKCFNFKSSN